MDRQLLEMIWSKVSTIGQINSKIQNLEVKTDIMESKITQIDTQYEDLHKGVEFIENDVQENKQAINEIKDGMVSKDEYSKTQKELIDQSNRMRRKNVVFYNIPEKEEGTDCTGFINSLIQKIHSSLKIEDAHRSGILTPNRSMPRLIHALCFTRKDRNKILEEGPAVFKENIVNGNRIYVSDDVHPATREVHKKLLEKQKEYRKKGWYAFIPLKVPRVLKYRPGPKGSMTPIKVYTIKQ